MNDRPILFNGQMVREVLDGAQSGTFVYDAASGIRTGDLMWVKETWGLRTYHDETDWFRASIRGIPHDVILGTHCLEYAADWRPSEHAFWRPSSIMPRWASRFTLRITSVHSERSGDIICHFDVMS